MESTTLTVSKRKNHVVSSTDTEKLFDRIQYPFLIKILRTRNKKKVLQLTLFLMVKDQIKSSPPQMSNKTRMSTLSISIQFYSTPY